MREDSFPCSKMVVCRGLRVAGWGVLVISLGVGKAEATLRVPEPSSPVYTQWAAAAADDLSVDQDSTVAGNLRANNRLTVKAGSVVEGNVAAAEVDNRGTITGTVSTGAPPIALPRLWSEAEALALANRVLSQNTTFRDATIDDVVFVRGNVVLAGTIRGVGTIIATGNIDLEQVGSGQGPSQWPAATRMSLVAFQHVRVHQNRYVRGAIYAGHHATISQNATVKGVILAGRHIQLQQGVRFDYEPPDIEGPVVTVMAPPAGSFLRELRPRIEASFADEASGVDAASFALFVDEVEQTAAAQSSASGFVYQPSQTLGEALHTIRVELDDLAGNHTSFSWSFTLDVTAPSADIAAPADGRFLADSTPAVRVRFQDAVAGVDRTGVQLLLDGIDRSSSLAFGTDGATLATATALPEGNHTVQLTVRDRAGNQTSASHVFVTDTVVPEVRFLSPSEPVSPGDVTPEIVVTFTDATAGIKPGTVKVGVNGSDLTASCEIGADLARCQAPPLSAGLHILSATAIDRAGNPKDLSYTVEVLADEVRPLVTITSPADGALVASTSVLVQGSGSDDSALVAVDVNGVAGTLTGSDFAATAGLVEGTNHLFVTVSDAAGNEGSATVTVFADFTPPGLNVAAPFADAVVNAAEVRVAGSVFDENGVTAVTVNGLPAVLADGEFVATVAAFAGENLLTVRATDGAGNVRQDVVRIVRNPLPEVVITEPADLATVAATTVTVRGEVSDPAASVVVNGVAASVSGGLFTAVDVPLIEGGNNLTAVATAGGFQGTASVSVVRDLTPPRLAIALPADGAELAASSVTVSGLVNDIVPGTVNASEVVVSVNGVAAQVRNRSFAATVPVVAGPNQLRVEAVDEAGNRSETTISVQVAPAVGRRLEVVSGNGQEAVIGTVLAEPLVVSVVDSTGLPVVDQPVFFEVRGNDGALDGGARQLVRRSNLQGRAEVQFRLGGRAGVAHQFVEASAVGFGPPVVFAASALPDSPALVVVDSGDQQVGVAGHALPRPLIAAVVDAGSNRLVDVPVRFRVVEGAGHFANGEPEIVVPSDSDGRVVVPFVLDSEEGVASNVVEATIDGGLDGTFASFTATGWTAGLPEATSISGIVLDNQNLPIEGVTLRILDSPLTAVTDAKGLFRIPGAPVGTVKLVVDGSTALRPNAFPDLEFVLNTVAGRDNTVNMPIYLVPLDFGGSVAVDETRGGTITLADMPGFALEIAPGSVTFPGGSRSGVVSVTLVHSDKVPMVPNFGQQPRFIVTIQPAGARFEPPARLTMPNVEGLPAGQVTEFYSFDHDLGHFVSIGPATVSDEGLLITSNPGVGIVKAGWHCGGSPSSSGTTHNCPRCQRCQGSTCVPDNAQSCNDSDDCTVNDRCQNGSCKGDKRKINSLDAKGNGSTSPEVFIERDVNFTVTVNGEHCTGGDLSYQWNFGDGQSSTSQSPAHKYKKPGTYNAQVTVKCRNTCATKSATVTVKVKCPTITITRTDPNLSVLCPGCTMQFFATVDPPDFTVKFRMAPGGELGGAASVTEGGLLTIAAAARAGNAVVRATVTDDGQDCFVDRSIQVFVPPSLPRVGDYTPSELAWAAANPGCAWQNRSLNSECFAELNRVVANGDIAAADKADPKAGNAFLHAYCNCLLAERCGVNVARDFWNAHEEWNGNTCQNSSMDFHNNEVGRQVANSAGGCTANVLTALRGGRLRFMTRQYLPGECPVFRN